MGNLDYKKLYDLQDIVLKIIFSFENDFYLTGGTCLSRFYQEKRYSDDLDFFANSSNMFNFHIKKTQELLSKELDLKVGVQSKDFTRILINDLLQIDFINDRVSRYKDIIILENGYKIDNIENILSNKVTAVLGRDNPKDIFDIYLICKYYSFNWNNILVSSKEKFVFNKEDLILRLKTFPLILLEKINIIDRDFLKNFEMDHEIIIDDIINENNNNLIK